MMMGTADEIVKAPEKGPVFMEDLPEEEQVVAVVRFLTLPFTKKLQVCLYLPKPCLNFLEENRMDPTLG